MSAAPTATPPATAALSVLRPSAAARRFWLLIPILLLALGGSIVAGVAVGAVPLPFEKVVRIIFSHLLPGLTAVDWAPTEDQIVWQFRLPRVLLAVIVGAALAVSGTGLQAMVRNPLADPYIFGVSSGAAAAAVAVITLGAAAAGGFSLSFAAFLGALGTMVLVYVLARQGGRAAPARLVLAGVAIGYVLSAVTSYLVLRSATPGGGAAAVLTWLAGSLGGAKWDYLGLPALAVLVSTMVLMLQARPLNALLAGEESAIGLGVNVERFRMQLFVITSLMVGTVVAISGAIGFVGLMIPHIVRMLVGADHRRVLLLAALLGGVYLVLADLVGRTIIAPQELPVGIVTAALGGPFFIWLMRQRHTRGGG